MISWDFRFIGLAAAVFLAATTAIEAKPKPTTKEASVQLLANFPALQRLGAKGDARAIDKYLARVAAAYREVGHGEFADALPSARTLLKLFGDPASAETRGAFKKARTTLRHLAKALAKNPRIVVPAKAGERLPDYYGLAVTFTSNGDRALKRLQAGKSIANFLRRSPGAGIWVTNLDGTEFTIDDVDVYTYSEGSVSFNIGSFDINTSGSGTLTLSGVNTYTGGTWISAGTLSIEGVSYLGTFNYGFWGGSNGILPLQAVPGFRWIAFPPDVVIPEDWASLYQLTLKGDTTVGEKKFVSGTRIVSAPEDYPLPENTIEVPATYMLFSGPTPAPTPTPSPSPTPAE